MKRISLATPKINLFRSRLAIFLIVFLLASILLQAFTFAPGANAPISATPPVPPSEKLLCQFGQWESEYWSDNGILSFMYVGDTTPAIKLTGHVLQADFSISKPTLLTAIVTVHLNSDLTATHRENASVGSLSLVDDVGNYYGPFPAEMVSAVNGDLLATTGLWVAAVDNVELPAGHYLVIDSDTSSVLFNAQTNGVPATVVKGIDAEGYARYMDALVAAIEPEPEGQPVTSGSAGNTGSTPEKVTYSKPQVVVNNPPPADSAISYPPNAKDPVKFTTLKPQLLTKILDYHINNGKGKTPGKIWLSDMNGGNTIGPWQAYGQAFSGIPNAVWAVTPNVEIPAGKYRVLDSDFGSLSGGSDGRALSVVTLAPVVKPPMDYVTGRYVIAFADTDVYMIWAVVDLKKTIDVGFVIEGWRMKMVFDVTERGNGVVKAKYRVGRFMGEKFGLTCYLTFKKNGEKYVVTGPLSVLYGNPEDNATANLAGSRTSTDMPGFIPKPPAGVGKVGDIPGPANTTQAVAGIAFPALATVIAASAASMVNTGGNTLPSSGTQTGNSGDSDGDDSDSDSESDGEGEGGDGGDDGEDSGSVDDTGQPEAGGVDPGTTPAIDPSASVQPPAIDPSASVQPPPITAPPPQPVPPPVTMPTTPVAPTPVNGETKTVFDAGDKQNKTYIFNAGTGDWVNPLTGGVYVAANYAASAQAAAETNAETVKRATADANAKMDIPSPFSDPDDPRNALAAGATASAAKTAEPSKPKPVYVEGLTPEQIAQRIDTIKGDLLDIDQDLKAQNIYVANKFHRDPTLVAHGLEVAFNGVWDSTVGQITGSKGLTCGGYYDKTIAHTRDAILKQFPNAKVEEGLFMEQSSYEQKGVVDQIDNIVKDNHRFIKVTLPDKSVWAIDFHGANANMISKNPPIMRPYADLKKEWKENIGSLDFRDATDV